MQFTVKVPTIYSAVWEILKQNTKWKNTVLQLYCAASDGNTTTLLVQFSALIFSKVGQTTL